MKKNISVIMAVYKETEEQLRASIESILNQTYSSFEYIIILDNPDELWRKDLIESYNDERIKLYVNKKNVGLTESLNKALKYASCKYIARMDADDISMPDRLKKQIKYLEMNNIDICGSFVEYFDDEGYTKYVSFPQKHDSISKALKYYNCLSHPSWFAKKNVYDKNNGYIDICTCEDYDFLVRAVLNGFKLGNVPEILLRYRLSPNGISRQNALKQEVVAEFIRKYYKHKKIVSLDAFKEYYESDAFNRKVNKYVKFSEKNKIRKRTKFLKKILYSVLILFSITIYPKRIVKKIQEKRIR